MPDIAARVDVGVDDDTSHVLLNMIVVGVLVFSCS